MKNVFYKTVLLFIIYYSLFICANAQQQFKVGLLGGISTTQVDGDTYSGYDKLGIYAGGFVTKNFSSNKRWSGSFEITYIEKGSRKTPHPDNGDYSSYSLKLDYAEVPLLVRYAFMMKDSSGKRKMRFAFEGGIAIGALVYHHEENALGVVGSGAVPFQKTDYSTVIGLNYFFSEHIVFDVRYEYSIFPVRKGATGQYYQNWTDKFLKPGYYNNGIFFSIRYQF